MFISGEKKSPNISIQIIYRVFVHFVYIKYGKVCYVMPIHIPEFVVQISKTKIIKSAKVFDRFRFSSFNPSLPEDFFKFCSNCLRNYLPTKILYSDQFGGNLDIINFWFKILYLFGHVI